MPKRFAIRDQTKCSSQDGIFKPRQTVLKSCGKQAVLEKEIRVQQFLFFELKFKFGKKD